MQEQLLSLRTLYLSPAQLFWECRELQSCETYPQSCRGLTLGASTIFLRNQLQDTLNPSRALTWMDHKLVAISGIVRWEYISGLCEKDLICNYPSPR